MTPNVATATAKGLSKDIAGKIANFTAGGERRDEQLQQAAEEPGV